MTMTADEMFHATLNELMDAQEVIGREREARRIETGELRNAIADANGRLNAIEQRHAIEFRQAEERHDAAIAEMRRSADAAEERLNRAIAGMKDEQGSVQRALSAHGLNWRGLVAEGEIPF